MKKENKTGPEQAKLITDAIAAPIEQLAAYLKSQNESELKESNLSNFEATSLKIIFGVAYMPTVIELFSAALKDLTPNMKKKKAEEFDTLKV